jgi:hypothetical protein
VLHVTCKRACSTADLVESGCLRGLIRPCKTTRRRELLRSIDPPQEVKRRRDGFSLPGTIATLYERAEDGYGYYMVNPEKQEHPEGPLSAAKHAASEALHEAAEAMNEETAELQHERSGAARNLEVDNDGGFQRRPPSD